MHVRFLITTMVDETFEYPEASGTTAKRESLSTSGSRMVVRFTSRSGATIYGGARSRKRFQVKVYMGSFLQLLRWMVRCLPRPIAYVQELS